MLEMSSGVSAPTMGLGISHGTGGGEGVAGSCRHRAQSQNQASSGNNSQQQQQQQPGQQQQQQQQQQLQSSSSQQQSRQQQRPTNGPMGRSKKDNCCLCWCCCCSCSCLARVGGSSTGGGGPSDRLRNKGDRAGELASGLSGISGECAAAGASNGLDRLDHLDFLKCCTLEEIRGWGSSFEKLMKSSSGRKLFREFLLSEYSDENIAFWLACEQLKRETDPERIEELARFIYDDYISILSPKEVSLDSRVREIVNRNMVEPTPHIFDEAQLQIYTLMHRDSYPRFVNSDLYRNAAKLSSGPPSPTSGDNHGSGKSKSKKGQT